jgi:hypothetical protein
VHFREGQKNLLRSLQIVLEGPETRRAVQTEAEHTMSAGRRRKPEAVSGRRTEQGNFRMAGRKTDVPDHFREADFSVLTWPGDYIGEALTWPACMEGAVHSHKWLKCFQIPAYLILSSQSTPETSSYKSGPKGVA